MNNAMTFIFAWGACDDDDPNWPREKVTEVFPAHRFHLGGDRLSWRAADPPLVRATSQKSKAVAAQTGER
jgi:hypothetical protein